LSRTDETVRNRNVHKNRQEITENTDKTGSNREHHNPGITTVSHLSDVDPDCSGLSHTSAQGP